jgi:hypothetical protein
MRLLLFIAVLALGTDALLYNGSYTQATWREATVYADKLIASVRHNAPEVRVNGQG